MILRRVRHLEQRGGGRPETASRDLVISSSMNAGFCAACFSACTMRPGMAPM
jgi:hypothetical protein